MTKKMTKKMTAKERLEMAQTWLDWVKEQHAYAKYESHRYDWHTDEDRSILGYLVQASAEQPEAFARAFAPILGSDPTNPLTAAGADELSNLKNNGIGDDWEIFLQWRETGYVVVPENLRQPQDARFRVNEAIRLLDIITGGQVRAPGQADTGVLLQHMYETEAALAPVRGRKTKRSR